MGSSAWRKASHSGANNACIEIRAIESLVELRESDDAGVILRTTPTAFTALLRAIKAGELDETGGA
ncbi:DUF397 domain-containing protein [Kitasatospora sp. NPDC093806]|uniref:DUF397 domain-containing protein n=1 Tax=Kitasatospora sp. NPDC093806 TaxID=3155075 RepID=UPI003412063C